MPHLGMGNVEKKSSMKGKVLLSIVSLGLLLQAKSRGLDLISLCLLEKEGKLHNRNSYLKEAEIKCRN
jgi:hypothetical protein